ncbi:MAG: patatin-like phospholipase family protein [Pseudomonadales bacterium]
MNDITHPSKHKPTVSLVLSSGGARGLFHIGAIKSLTERGYDVRYVSGSSMGALVGGIYAAGKLDEFAEWVSELRRGDIVKLLDFGWGANAGLFKGERIISFLQELVGEFDIEDLPIGYTAVAAELNRKREVWISSGSLFGAIRASIAIPLVLSPAVRGDQLLVDGAVLNPLPIAPALTQHNDLIVAIDVNGMDEHSLNPQRPVAGSQSPIVEDSKEEIEEQSSIRVALTNFMDDFFTSDEPDKIDHGMFDIATESMDAMQVTISRLKLSVYSPDLLVQVPRNVAHFFEFDRAKELIELGYQRMEEALGEDE